MVRVKVTASELGNSLHIPVLCPPVQDSLCSSPDVSNCLVMRVDQSVEYVTAAVRCRLHYRADTGPDGNSVITQTEVKNTQWSGRAALLHYLIHYECKYTE